MSPAEATAHSEIEAINEPRTARMDQRTKPSVKASIEAAADLMGIEASAFVVMSAYARAQELLSSSQQSCSIRATTKPCWPPSTKRPHQPRRRWRPGSCIRTRSCAPDLVRYTRLFSASTPSMPMPLARSICQRVELSLGLLRLLLNVTAEGGEEDRTRLHRFYAAMGFKPLPGSMERLFLHLRAISYFQPGG